MSWRPRSQQDTHYASRSTTFQRGSAYYDDQEEKRYHYNNHDQYNAHESRPRLYPQARNYVNRHQYQPQTNNDSQRNGNRYARSRGGGYHRYNDHNNSYNTYNRFNPPYHQNTRGRGHRYYDSNRVNHAISKPEITPKRNDVKFVRNTGKFQVELLPQDKLICTLENIWNRYIQQQNDDKYRVEKLILLCGPPGCGKSTICKFAMEYYKLDEAKQSEYILDASQMCSDVMKENQRVLITAKVYEKLFAQILQNKHAHTILMVDGFMRMEQHVDVAHFLKKQMAETQLIFLVVNIDEATSVKRQLERGKKLMAEPAPNGDDKMAPSENATKQRLKESDLDESAARRRYVKYSQPSEVIRFKLKSEMKVSFDVIDGTEPLHKVREMVEQQLKKQGS